ncbi:MAG TPA: site-specific integrase [Stellaceae bacterium]|nr:site-specific integrase [Stellaceae bacterium]
MTLSDFGVKALKPGPTRYTQWDALVPGFGIRVTPTGVKSFFVFARKRGHKHAIRLTLGRYLPHGGGLSVGDARDMAKNKLGILARGEDPREIEEQKRQEEARRHADTFAVVVDDFIKHHVSRRLRHARAAEALIRREFLGQERKKTQDENGKVVEEWVAGRDAKWREKPITTIRRRDAITLLEDIVHHRSLSPARKVHAAGSKLFNWAIQRDQYGLEHNPFTLINFKEQFGAVDPRDRILSDDELRSVWNASNGLGYPFGDLTRGLMLSAQRENEIARAQLPDLDMGRTMLVVPRRGMKGKAAHTVPLTRAMVALLNDCLKVERDKHRLVDGPFIFSTTAGRRPISGFSKAKKQLDKVIAEQRKKDELPAMAHWVFHDLRRTARTRMGALGILPEIAERVIAHKPAKRSVRTTYDLYTYDREKREALEKWEAALLAIVEPKPGPAGKIVPFAEEQKRRQHGGRS